ncbi:DUF4190 domain-containing protein [Curtobacterium albidum]|uniref:DUF4190 domain-containing protein n=2 Tax=Curtobacterium citreum TaxID=2036 RepID=A0A850E2F6_9MICO|nr:DUF4190 domain-containing protein [Curtobacterium albidum]
MSDQNQWPKPDESSNASNSTGSSNPTSSASGSQAPQSAPQSAPQYPYSAPGQQQNPYGQPQQQSNPYAVPHQQQSNPYAPPQQQSNPYQQPSGAQYGQQQGGQYGQQPSNPYAQPQQQSNPYAASYASTGYQPYAQRPKTNTLAVLSIVFGLGAIPLFFMAILLGPAGAILGHIALGKIKQNGEGGRALALTGIIAGWVMTGFWILWIIALVVFAGFSSSYSDPYGYDSGAFVG